MSEEGTEFNSLEEFADQATQQEEGFPAVEVWQDYDPSMRFTAIFPVTEKQGAQSSTVAYYIFEPGRHSSLHSDNAEEVIYCADGNGEIFVSGKQVKVEPGDFTVIPAGVQHDIYAYGDTELRLLSYFPVPVVESSFQDPVMPMGGTVLSSNMMDAPVIREISGDELPPEIRHLIESAGETPTETPEG
jgi:quercetin dioxygenase-like cupin family protein